jgi:alpha-N-arabinofuranosidase
MKTLSLPLVLGMLSYLLTASPVHSAAPTDVTINVRVDQPGVVPTQFGIFFEDINYGGDGGLYPERVKNRSFEFADPLMGWTKLTRGNAQGALSIRRENPLNTNNLHYLRVQVDQPGAGLGLANEGFFGMGLHDNQSFVFSVYARSLEADPPKITVELEDEEGRILAQGMLARITHEWQRHSCTLRSRGTQPKAHLNLLIQGPGVIELDMVSLFPKDTWKNRPNGLRPDVVQLLADLKPAFMRFPGGCIVEGRDLNKRYQWKTTTGDVAERKLIVNRWNDEFKHRPAPDYFQSFGLGFFEFFQLCEDIGSEPLPILNCGMACQFNTGELVPMDQLDPYIQDALDLIEFANGPVSTAWGARRAAMGHPAPFRMRLLGIGNEQWGPQYIERYARFAEVLKAKHPEIQLVSSAGPRLNDELYQFLWPKLRELSADIVDEHCYDRPAWFLDNAFRYDSFERKGPKVFMGEYAAQSVKVVSPENRNDWECALAEAAFMTGLERNADVVTMSSYAPLSGHEEGWQWRPNLLWFDNLQSYGSPSYYVQQLFGVHRGTAILPVKVQGQPTPSSTQPGLYASANHDDRTGEVILKVVNSAPEIRTARFQLTGATQIARSGTVTVLTSEKLTDENSLQQPRKVAPMTRRLAETGAEFSYVCPPISMSVLRLKAK